jgi:hypothetical protein
MQMERMLWVFHRDGDALQIYEAITCEIRESSEIRHSNCERKKKKKYISCAIFVYNV